MGTSAAGHLALAVVIVTAAAAVVTSLLSPVRAEWARVGRGLLAVSALAGAVATALLARALMHLDLSLVYVADASSRGASGAYRLAGLWGAMAGSLLLWLAMTAAVAALVAPTIARRLPHLAATTQVVLASMVLAVAVVSRWASDPFRRLAIPAIDGGGLVPILRHPAMLVHPPLIYLGLVLTLAPFAVTFAALVHRRLDTVWVGLVRRLALVSWLVLVVAMAIGAHWSYAELGWGGYWAWDPVENGVLLPWLTLTATLHAGQLAARRGARAIDAALPMATFVLASLGAVLTRSGAVASVHAFAEARRVGTALAVVGVVVVGGSVVALVVGRPRPPAVTPPTDAPTVPVVRALRTNNALLGAMAVVVLVGTVAPVVAGWFGGPKRAVGGHYFAGLVLPIALALLLVLGWSAGARRTSRRWTLLLGEAAAVMATLVGGWHPWVIALVAAAVFAGASAVAVMIERRALVGGQLAHVGLAMVLVGVAGTSLGATRSFTVQAGSTFDVRGYHVTVGELGVQQADDHQRVVIPLTVQRGSSIVARLEPQWRVYPSSGIVLAVMAGRSTPLEDLQIVPTRVTAASVAFLEVHVRPLAWWLWWGAGLMAVGALWSLRPRRRRSAVAPALAGEELLQGVGRPT